jgi:hypothetical protein
MAIPNCRVTSCIGIYQLINTPERRSQREESLTDMINPALKPSNQVNSSRISTRCTTTTRTTSRPPRTLRTTRALGHHISTAPGLYVVIGNITSIRSLVPDSIAFYIRAARLAAYRDVVAFGIHLLHIIARAWPRATVDAIASDGICTHSGVYQSSTNEEGELHDQQGSGMRSYFLKALIVIMHYIFQK